jgi:uncharacterized protein (TIGR02453 family)
MAFSGWPAEALTFYEGLEADNSKAYWTANKPIYDTSVLAPMTALLDELAEEFGEGRIFRPNRDIRFSADKSPYKTAIGAILERGGYVQLSAHGLASGAGYYHLEPDQLERYRAAVADERRGEKLREVLAAAESDGVKISVRDSLKGAPRGYDKDHPRADLLRYKDLATWRQWPVAGWLSTSAAKDHVVEFLRSSRPLMAWLEDNVGRSRREH